MWPFPHKKEAWECYDPGTGEFDHDWEYVSDWAGDPGVIGGTYDIRYRDCKVCGFVDEETTPYYWYED